MTLNPRVLLLAIAAIAAAGAAPALAQGTDSPPAGVFGGGTANPNAHQKLAVTLSLASAYDSDLSEAVPVAVSQLVGSQPTAHSNMLVGSVDYGWDRPSMQFQASGSSTVRHDRLNDDIRGLAHRAQASFTGRLPRRTMLMITQTATYAPSYLYALFPQAGPAAPGNVPPAEPDSPAADFEAYSHDSQVTLTHDVTRRMRLSAIADGSHTDYRGTTAGQPELTWYGMTGLAAYGVRRNTKATVRYRYREGNFGDAAGTTTLGILTTPEIAINPGISMNPGISTEHGVELGMVHDRPLSRTRKMTFDVVLGGSLVIPPETPAVVRPRDPSHRFVGQMGMAFPLGRTWLARALYRHGVDYVPGLTAPVSTNGVNTRIDGLITRRVDLLVSAAYSSGKSVWNRNGPTFDTYAGDARVRYALARTAAVYVEYVYYFYDFSGTPQLAPGMANELERHGVRAGFTLWIPALGR